MLCITCPFLKVQIVFTDLESSDEVGSGVVWARHKSKIVSASRFYHRHSSNLYGDSSPAHDSGMKAMPGRNRVRITLLVSSKKLQGEQLKQWNSAPEIGVCSSLCLPETQRQGQGSSGATHISVHSSTATNTTTSGTSLGEKQPKRNRYDHATEIICWCN